MLTHVVMYKLEDHSSGSIERALEKIRALEGKVPSLRSLEVGCNIVPSARAYDLALIARFDDLAGLQAYQSHPEHQPVLDYMRAVSEGVTAVDFESA
ncbi:MAG: Dabb family protein [Ardenticatenaceae bacterium]|nr:Dabb family protein [Ardenticatenaceae bacterium]